MADYQSAAGEKEKMADYQSAAGCQPAPHGEGIAMRYMMLIYSKEVPGGLSAEEDGKHRMAHRTLISEATEKGVLVGAEPLAPISTATTVRVQDGKALITDGPFAETKEQLAGYYIIDCMDLEDAKQWAAKIPTSCYGGSGCIEIRPLPGLSKK